MKRKKTMVANDCHECLVITYYFGSKEHLNNRIDEDTDNPARRCQPSERKPMPRSMAPKQQMHRNISVDKADVKPQQVYFFIFFGNPNSSKFQIESKQNHQNANENNESIGPAQCSDSNKKIHSLAQSVRIIILSIINNDANVYLNRYVDQVALIGSLQFYLVHFFFAFYNDQ